MNDENINPADTIERRIRHWPDIELDQYLNSEIVDTAASLIYKCRDDAIDSEYQDNPIHRIMLIALTKDPLVLDRPFSFTDKHKEDINEYIDGILSEILEIRPNILISLDEQLSPGETGEPCFNKELIRAKLAGEPIYCYADTAYLGLLDEELFRKLGAEHYPVIYGQYKIAGTEQPAEFAKIYFRLHPDGQYLVRQEFYFGECESALVRNFESLLGIKNEPIIDIRRVISFEDKVKRLTDLKFGDYVMKFAYSSQWNME